MSDLLVALSATAFPFDIAHAVAFLASDSAGWVTGLSRAGELRLSKAAKAA